MLLFLPFSMVGQGIGYLDIGILGGISSYSGDFTSGELGLKYRDTYGIDYGFQFNLPVADHWDIGFSYASSRLSGDSLSTGYISPGNPNFVTVAQKIGISGSYLPWRLYEDRNWVPYISLEEAWLFYVPKYIPNPSNTSDLRPISPSADHPIQSSFVTSTEIGFRFVIWPQLFLQASTQAVWLVPGNIDGIDTGLEMYQRINLGVFFHFDPARSSEKKATGGVRCYEF